VQVVSSAADWPHGQHRGQISPGAKNSWFSNDKWRKGCPPITNTPTLPDLKLEEKLHPEWPGILRWMIDGCLKWQAGGIPRPAIVSDTTSEYFADQDIFEQWLDHCVEKKKGERTRGPPRGASRRAGRRSPLACRQAWDQGPKGLP
jgi:hypothetical protein